MSDDFNVAADLSGSGVPDDRNYPGREHTVEISEMVLVHRSGSLDLFAANAFVQLNIYEDLFQNCTTGNVFVSDAAGWFEEFPICGDEQLRVRFKTSQEYPGPYYEKTFAVFACRALDTVNGGRGRQYQLSIASAPFVTNHHKRVRRSYMQTKENAIVANLAAKGLGIENISAEETRYRRNIVIPGWRPLYAINYLAKTSVRKKGYPASNYVFFETQKQFKFCSIDSLIDEEIDREHVPQMDFHVSRISVPKDKAKIWNVRDFRAIKTFDNVNNSISGQYGHRFMAQDIIRKQYKEADQDLTYDYRAEFPKQPHSDLGGTYHRLKFKSDPDQSLVYGPWQPGYDYDSEHANDWAKRRRPMLQEWQSYAWECQTEGNTSITVGDLVRFNIYSSQPGSEDYDARLSGFYLLTRIGHTVDNREHRMTVTIVKDDLLT